MFQTIFADLPALMFTFAAGAALVGLLVWVFAAQGAASRRTAYAFWGVAAGFALVGLIRLFTR